MKINGYFILDGEVKSFHVTDPKRGLDNVLFERARPHGEWKFNADYKNDDFQAPFFCSECGAGEDYTSKFCPNCGAPMSANDRQVTGKLNSEIENSKSEKSCLNCGTSECELGNRARHGFCGNWTERR